MEITAITCGPQCIDGTEEHKWDGPIIKLERGASSSCSKCGMLAIDFSMWIDDEAVRSALDARRSAVRDADAESQKAQDIVENASAKKTDGNSPTEAEMTDMAELPAEKGRVRE